MIFIENTTDFEMYSSTSKGAIQGYGYQVGHSGGGTRLLRLHSVTSFSVHDIALVDGKMPFSNPPSPGRAYTDSILQLLCSIWL